MSVSFKFKSEHDFARHELEAGAASISAAALKKVIVEVKLNGSTGAFGLKLSNAQTGEGARARPERASPLPQDHPALPRRTVRTFHASLRRASPTSLPHVRAEYLDDDARIPAEASVVVRRVPLSRPARGGGCCSAQTNLCVGPLAQPASHGVVGRGRGHEGGAARCPSHRGTARPCRAATRGARRRARCTRTVRACPRDGPLLACPPRRRQLTLVMR